MSCEVVVNYRMFVHVGWFIIVSPILTNESIEVLDLLEYITMTTKSLHASS